MTKLSDIRVYRTPHDAAEWMLGEVLRTDSLTQEAAVEGIRSRFGRHLLNDSETQIGKDVLEAFSELSKETVVWDPHNRLWRLRRHGDKSGRQQD